MKAYQTIEWLCIQTCTLYKDIFMIIKATHLAQYIEESKPTKDSRILLFITREEKEKLQKISLSTGMSMNEIVRRSLFNTILMM